MSDVRLKEFDDLLNKYYKSFNINHYKSRLAANFENFCNENGLGTDQDIIDEFRMSIDDPEQCIFVDFDTKFPLSNNTQNENLQKKEIWNVLKGMWDTMELPDDIEEKLPDATPNINFDIENKARREHEKVYEKQLTALGRSINKEPDLLKMFAIGRANDLPFITFMVDSYTIDKAKYYVKNKETLTIDNWALNENPFMKQLKKRKPEIFETIKSAMIAYSNRILTRLIFTPRVLIDDDKNETLNYISSFPTFIKFLMNNKESKSSPPFSIDLCFGVAVKEKVKSKLCNDADDDDEKDETATSIGDIKEKLKSRGRIFYSHNTDQETLLKADTHQFARYLHAIYNSFRDELSKNTKRFNGVTYPKHRRFGMFVDRDNGRKNDEITFFEQLEECDEIPSDFVSEWPMNAARKCLIPGKDDQHNVTSKDALNGKLLTFQFNVEAADAIKCYIIWNGQTMRFKGDNLADILSFIFVEDKENKEENPDRDDYKERISTFNKELEDSKFESFYKQINL